MTLPRHHLDADELLSYAAGTTPEWASLLIACHLTLCETCRKDLEFYDDLGGVLLGTLEPRCGRTPRLDEILQAQLGEGDHATPKPLLVEPGLPSVLSPYFKDARPRWRFLAPGVAQMPLVLSVNGCPVRVVRFAPGYRVPEHVHTARETLLLFRGSIKDSRTGESFHRGDVYRSDSGSKHEQTVGSEEPCVSLLVNEGRVRPTSWIGRVLARLTGV